MESLINKAEVGFWGFFILFLVIGAIPLIFRKKKDSKNKSNLNQDSEGKMIESNSKHIITPTSTVSDLLKIEDDKNTQLLKEVDLQETELQQLKIHKLLTEEEFSRKKEIVLKRKYAILQELDKIHLEQEMEKVKSEVNEQIRPQLLLLENTLKSSLLTQDEFDIKRNQLFNDRYNCILMLLFQNPGFHVNLEVINEKEFKKYYTYEINASLPKFKFGDIVLLIKKENHLQKFSFDKFLEFNKSKDASEYSYVNIPNLLSRIGYPQLQKKLSNGPLRDE